MCGKVLVTEPFGGILGMPGTALAGERRQGRTGVIVHYKTYRYAKAALKLLGFVIIC